MNKKTRWILVVACMFSSLSMAAVQLSEPVVIDADSETFAADAATGRAQSQASESLELTSVLQAPESFLKHDIALKLKVAKVCQKKGCFFIGQQDSQYIRVSFKDYGFFVPTHIAGRTVTLVGKLVARTVSADEAEHMSKDIGEEGAVASGDAYEFIAASVRVFHADREPV